MEAEVEECDSAVFDFFADTVELDLAPDLLLPAEIVTAACCCCWIYVVVDDGRICADGVDEDEDDEANEDVDDDVTLDESEEACSAAPGSFRFFLRAPIAPRAKKKKEGPSWPLALVINTACMRDGAIGAAGWLGVLCFAELELELEAEDDEEDEAEAEAEDEEEDEAEAEDEEDEPELEGGNNALPELELFSLVGRPRRSFSADPDPGITPSGAAASTSASLR